MRSLFSRCALGALALCGAFFVAGCGDEEIKLKDAPATKIGELKQEKETGSKDSLKKGAPATGSSAGIRHNPSETPP